MELCPCGSEKDYNACCQPLIKGERAAETAEALMRSRYTAHAKKEYDYIFDTTQPAKRQDSDRKETAAWSKKLDWQSLEIRNVAQGGPDDSSGTVEFVARYRKNGTAFDHHEIAEFVREDDRWYFKDGQPPQPVQAVRQGPKIGRNDPCPCGSGKKFKKCCGV
jgi:SEC-C motif-containing protein